MVEGFKWFRRAVWEYMRQRAGTILPSWRLGRSVVFPLVPADNRLRDAVGRCEIRLDVEKRRSIKAVETDDREPGTFDLQQLDDAHGNRVRAGRGAQGERPAFHAALAWHLKDEGARRPVHPVKQHDMAAGFDIL